MPNEDTPIEQSFDPATPAGWESLRALGHDMLDDMLRFLEDLDNQPVWQAMPDDVAVEFDKPVPMAGIGQRETYDRFRNYVLPYHNGNLHPRFFGWVRGNGTPYAMLAEMLSAGLNAHLGGFSNAPPKVEQQVVNWFADLFGLHGASGLFVTGGTMANTLGIAVARFANADSRGYDIRSFGLQSWPATSSPPPMVFYGSSETHNWAVKAAEWLGLGRRAFRAVRCNSDYQMDIARLESRIASDRAEGLQPFCIIGTAGTVNTGSSDDLEALADLAKREKLWFHVDGAFGALLSLSPSLRHIVKGMERADSIGFDLHKWGSMPFECGCVLIRDPEMHRRTFATPAEYLEGTTRGVAAGGAYFAERGLDLTRGFKALKVWMSLQADGVDKLAHIINQNVHQVQHLVSLIESSDRVEMLAPAPINIACFRYLAPGLDAGSLNAFNAELLLRLQERGIAVPSSTHLNGIFALRVAHVNHRSRTEDIDTMFNAIIDIGKELEAEAFAYGSPAA